MKKLWLVLLVALVCTSAFATEKYPADLYSTHHGDDPAVCKWDGIYTRIAHNYPTGTDAIDIELEDGTCLPDGSTGEAIMLSVVDASNPYNVKEIFYDCTGRTGNTIENCERFYGQAVLEDDVVMLSFTGRMYEDIREALETSHRGSMESSFQLDMDNTGPRLKAGTGAISARNAADNAYVNLECATPTEANDATTKNWIETYYYTSAYLDGTTGKADKVSDAVEGDFCEFDDAGNLVDSGLSASTDITLSADSDSIIPTQKATKAYVDSLWSADMHFITTADEIISAFADTTPGYHNYVVAPGTYSFSSDILIAPNRRIQFLPGVEFLLNNSAKITLGRVVNTHIWYPAWDVKCTIHQTTGVITGSSATLGAAFDWKAFAELPGAQLYTRGLTFDVASATATTITPVADQIGYEVSQSATPYPCALMVPVGNINISGNMKLTAGAVHDGQMIDLQGCSGCNFGKWEIDAKLPATLNTHSVFSMAFMANGRFPRIVTSGQTCQVSGSPTLEYFDAPFCHNMLISGFEINHMRFIWNADATPWFRALELNFSSWIHPDKKWGLFIRELRVENSFAAKNANRRYVQALAGVCNIIPINHKDGTGDGTGYEWEYDGYDCYVNNLTY